MKATRWSEGYSARFYELQVGDCFEFMGDLHLKVAPNAANLNAVNLIENTLHYISDDEVVFPARVELSYVLCSLDNL